MCLAFGCLCRTVVSFDAAPVDSISLRLLWSSSIPAAVQLEFEPGLLVLFSRQAYSPLATNFSNLNSKQRVGAFKTQAQQEACR